MSCSTTTSVVLQCRRRFVSTLSCYIILLQLQNLNESRCHKLSTKVSTHVLAGEKEHPDSIIGPPFSEPSRRRFKPRYDEKRNFCVNKILSSMKLEALLYV